MKEFVIKFYVGGKLRGSRYIHTEDYPAAWKKAHEISYEISKKAFVEISVDEIKKG